MNIAFLINTFPGVSDRNTQALVKCDSLKKIHDKIIKISMAIILKTKLSSWY